MTATSDGCATSTQEDRLLAAGRAAVAEATKLWDRDIYDPARNDYSPRGVLSRVAINEIVRSGGWTRIDYRGDGDLEWCGLFVAACWRSAGIDPKWLATYFASTYRLDLWARYREFDPKHPNPRQVPPRLLAQLDRDSVTITWTPRAGDILLIGDGNPPFGDHICLVESFDPDRNVFHTLEGNGIGIGPDGKRRQGVVRGVRHLGGGGYCARRLIRPSACDLL